MNQNKICPDCEAEFLPHIEKCADCGAVLLTFEEHRKAQEERKRIAEKIVENTVVVREGDLDWMSELQDSSHRCRHSLHCPFRCRLQERLLRG